MLGPFSLYCRGQNNGKASYRSNPRRSYHALRRLLRSPRGRGHRDHCLHQEAPDVSDEFYNIHANDGEIRKVERLTAEERGWIIDYCRYRLDIDTDLKTQDDVEMCRKK